MTKRHRIVLHPGYSKKPVMAYVVNADEGRRRARGWSRIIINGTVAFYRWDGKRYRKTLYRFGERVKN